MSKVTIALRPNTTAIGPEVVISVYVVKAFYLFSVSFQEIPHPERNKGKASSYYPSDQATYVFPISLLTYEPYAGGGRFLANFLLPYWV